MTGAKTDPATAPGSVFADPQEDVLTASGHEAGIAPSTSFFVQSGAVQIFRSVSTRVNSRANPTASRDATKMGWKP
jgi:hypothetical protein